MAGRNRSKFILGRDHQVKLSDGTGIGRVERRPLGWVGFSADGQNVTGQKARKTAGEAASSVFNAARRGASPAPRKAPAVDLVSRPPSPEFTARKSRKDRIKLCAEWYMREEGRSQAQAFAMCTSMEDQNRLEADGTYIPVAGKGRRAPGRPFDLVGRVVQVHQAGGTSKLTLAIGSRLQEVYFADADVPEDMQEWMREWIHAWGEVDARGRHWALRFEPEDGQFTGPREVYKALSDASRRSSLLRPGKTQVWYIRPTTTWASALGLTGQLGKDGPQGWTPALLPETHVLLGSVASDDPIALRRALQEEIWSPNGEARELLARLGLSRSSMVAGDVFVLPDGQVLLATPRSFLQRGAIKLAGPLGRGLRAAVCNPPAGWHPNSDCSFYVKGDLRGNVHEVHKRGKNCWCYRCRTAQDKQAVVDGPFPNLDAAVRRAEREAARRLKARIPFGHAPNDF